METIKHTLLNSDEETTAKTLENMDSNSILALKDVLVLLWQLHPDEAIQDKALGNLVQVIDSVEKAQIEAKKRV